MADWAWQKEYARRRDAEMQALRNNAGSGLYRQWPGSTDNPAGRRADEGELVSRLPAAVDLEIQDSQGRRNAAFAEEEMQKMQPPRGQAVTEDSGAALQRWSHAGQMQNSAAKVDMSEDTGASAGTGVIPQDAEPQRSESVWPSLSEPVQRPSAMPPAMAQEGPAINRQSPLLEGNTDDGLPSREAMRPDQSPPLPQLRGVLPTQESTAPDVLRKSGMPVDHPRFPEMFLQPGPYIGEPAPQSQRPQGVLGSLLTGTQRTAMQIDAGMQTILDRRQSVVDLAERERQLLSTAEAEAFRSDYEAEKKKLAPDAGWWDEMKALGSTAWRNLLGAIHSIAEGLPGAFLAEGVTDGMENKAALNRGVKRALPYFRVLLRGAASGAATGALAGTAAMPVGGTLAGAVVGTISGLAGAFMLGALVDTGAEAMKLAADDGRFTSKERQDSIKYGIQSGGVNAAVSGVSHLLGGFIRTVGTEKARKALHDITEDRLRKYHVDISDPLSLNAAAANPDIRRIVLKSQIRMMQSVTDFSVQMQSPRAQRVLRPAAAALTAADPFLQNYMNQRVLQDKVDSGEVLLEGLRSHIGGGAYRGVKAAGAAVVNRGSGTPPRGGPTPEGSAAPEGAATQKPLPTFGSARSLSARVRQMAGKHSLPFSNESAASRFAAQMNQKGGGRSPWVVVKAGKKYMPVPLDVISALDNGLSKRLFTIFKIC